jgi:UDP-N-acetylmuramyl pentapeptide phosphotransferase/UDP-N-acetylglucosamine-1-phosphate transferase
VRNNHRNAHEGSMSTPKMAGLAILVVLALLFMWAPWSGPRMADNIAPFTTVGSSTTRPSDNLSPTAPDAIIPATPSTTR